MNRVTVIDKKDLDLIGALKKFADIHNKNIGSVVGYIILWRFIEKILFLHTIIGFLIWGTLLSSVMHLALLIAAILMRTNVEDYSYTKFYINALIISCVCRIFVL